MPHTSSALPARPTARINPSPLRLVTFVTAMTAIATSRAQVTLVTAMTAITTSMALVTFVTAIATSVTKVTAMTAIST